MNGVLNCFGHPKGASGLHMICAMYARILEKMPAERKVKIAPDGIKSQLEG